MLSTGALLFALLVLRGPAAGLAIARHVVVSMLSMWWLVWKVDYQTTQVGGAGWLGYAGLRTSCVCRGLG